MESLKKDCKSLVKRCELQIRTSALINFGANPEKQGENKFDWSLTPNKMIGMTVAGVSGGLRTNSNFATPENMCIPGNFLTNFTIPTLVNPMIPALIIPYMPSINLPNSFPGMPPSPLPPPQVTPHGGY